MTFDKKNTLHLYNNFSGQTCISIFDNNNHFTKYLLNINFLKLYLFTVLKLILLMFVFVMILR